MFLYEIILDLHKTCNDLDRERCLEILAGYGVDPQVIRILQTYWGRLHMVVKSGGYRGHPFNVFHGVIQGNPLFPTIFNVAVDTVMRHWVVEVAEEEAGPEGLGHLIKRMEAYFYTDDGLIVLIRVVQLQRSCDVLADLFDRVHLQTSIHKTVSMVF